MDNVRLIIETLVKRPGVSQASIARSLGVPEKTLNAWMTGRVACRHAQMLSLALEALSDRIPNLERKIRMGRVIKDETITSTKRHRLTAEISGSGGRRVVTIYLDGNYEDYLDEWLKGWYLKVGDEGPREDQVKIGDSPEEALNWWIHERGFAVNP